jgi:biotin transporter BioY
VLALYVVKLIAVTRFRNRRTAVALYAATLAASLPYIYLLGTDWSSPFVDPRFWWTVYPVALLFVPTASFSADLLKWGRPKRAVWLVIRSAIEIVVLMPLWHVLCYWAGAILGWVPGP